MILTDLIFLIILTNALTGALYMKVWSAVSGCLEEKSDYISIYRWLRLGLLFYILPGLAVVFAGGFRALAAGMRQPKIFSPMKIAVFLLFAAAIDLGRRRSGQCLPLYSGNSEFLQDLQTQ